jgi:phage tail tape-measure protein
MACRKDVPMVLNIPIPPDEERAEVHASTEVTVMDKEMRESPRTSDSEWRKLDGALKIGGTTFGSTAIGAAVGSLLGPVGAASGAAIGGLAGAALSTWDTFWRHRPE